ncbi:hypothetical protein [Streptomyces sp. NBC_01363]|uniref:hypothetical protein n=1 Tax=Streptomyces sp. NBC_01363 TaxID=2903840 RepID=UPI00339048FC
MPALAVAFFAAAPEPDGGVTLSLLAAGAAVRVVVRPRLNVPVLEDHGFTVKVYVPVAGRADRSFVTVVSFM